MGRRTATLIATAIGLACASPAAQAAPGDVYAHMPRSASINASAEVPMEVTPSYFSALTTTVATTRWGIAIEGETLATPGTFDGVNSIGFSSALPKDVLGAYIFWPRRVFKATKLCQRRNHRRTCRRIKRYVYSEVTEADVAFSTAFSWNQGPGYPAEDQFDLPTVEIHELGHFNDPNTPHGRRCSGSPLTESLAYGEWWRTPADWYETECSNSPARRRPKATAGPPQPIFQRITHRLPDRVI